MRIGVLASIVVAGLFIAVVSALLQRSELLAQRPATPQPVRTSQASGEVIAFASENGEGRQQLIVIDPKTQAVAVYHVEKNSGLITLKSVRNVQWDLRMDDFNSGAPAPREIRAMLDLR